MEARWYFQHLVEPTIKDFEANPTSVRHAFLACVATFHTVDYLSAPKRPGNLRKTIGDACPSFAFIDRIAHGFKHVSSGPNEGDVKATDVISRPPATWDIGQWDLSRWDDSVGGVTLATDTASDLLDELTNAAAYLKTQIPSA